MLVIYTVPVAAKRFILGHLFTIAAPPTGIGGPCSNEDSCKWEFLPQSPGLYLQVNIVWVHRPAAVDTQLCNSLRLQMYIEQVILTGKFFLV